MTRTGEHRSRLQWAASVLMVVLMVLGTVGIIGALFGDLKKAEAATAGSYTIRVQIHVTNKADKQSNIQNSYYQVTYVTNNGKGSTVTKEQLYDLKANWTTCGLNSEAWHTFEFTVPGFPTYLYSYHDAVWTDKVHYTMEDIWIVANGNIVKWWDSGMNFFLNFLI